MEKQSVSITKAAKMLGVSRQVIYRLVKQGVFTVKPAHPAFAKHGPVNIPFSEIEQFATERGIVLKEPKPKA